MGAFLSGMTIATAGASLFVLLLFARSQRGGVSGPVGTFIGLLQIPLAVALLYLLAIHIGWWTIAVFVVLSLIVGVMVNRDNLGQWVRLQPALGLIMLGLAALAWLAHFDVL